VSHREATRLCQKGSTVIRNRDRDARIAASRSAAPAQAADVFAKPDAAKPDITKPDVTKPDVFAKPQAAVARLHSPRPMVRTQLRSPRSAIRAMGIARTV